MQQKGRGSIRKFAIAQSALALALAAAGCGGDDDDDASTADSSADPAPTVTPEAGAGWTVDVAADPSGELAYEPTELTANAGSVTIGFANETQVPHDVVVQKDGEDVGATEQITASTTQAPSSSTPAASRSTAPCRGTWRQA